MTTTPPETGTPTEDTNTERVGIRKDGTLAFGPTGVIEDDPSDNTVGTNTTAKAYEVDVDDAGIAGGDKMKETVTTIKYGAVSSYTNYANDRTLALTFVDELGRTIASTEVTYGYTLNKLKYFQIIKAKCYDVHNASFSGTGVVNSGVHYDYSEADDIKKVITRYDKAEVYIKQYAKITVDENGRVSQQLVADLLNMQQSNYAYKAADVLGSRVTFDDSEIDVDTEKKISIPNAAVIAIDTVVPGKDAEGKAVNNPIDLSGVNFDTLITQKNTVQSTANGLYLTTDYQYDSDALSYVNPYTATNGAFYVFLSAGEKNADGYYTTKPSANSLLFNDNLVDNTDKVAHTYAGILASSVAKNMEYTCYDTYVTYDDAILLSEGSDKPGSWDALKLDATEDISINSVFVHTPVLINLTGNCTKLVNQSILGLSGETTATPGSDLIVYYSEIGTHKGESGYMTRDYSEYTKDITNTANADPVVFMKFPFDIYLNGNYYKAGTTVKVDYDQTDNGNNFLTITIPTWVEEGSYTIEATVYAKNAMTEAQQRAYGTPANYDEKQYSAKTSLSVTIQGNVFGLEIYDISDYPLWQSVFRQNNSLDFKTGASAVTYSVGKRNWLEESNGHSSQLTLPLLDGSHTTNKKEGAIPLGYAFRYKVKTTGSMTDADDVLKITPTFYYVDKDGKNKQQVDVYYDDVINGVKTPLIKVGSDVDLNNKKSINTGDVYLGIPTDQLQLSASLQGTTLQKLQATTSSVYSFGEINLPAALRTFTGDTTKGTGTGVDASRLQKAEQTWYGEYYLPSSVHVCAKDFDVAGYAEGDGIDYTESFWLKKGYLIVNFRIETSNGGILSLSYNSGLEDTVNMFKQEGQMLNKTDSHGTTYDLEYGDVVFYDLGQSAASDYKSSGTH